MTESPARPTRPHLCIELQGLYDGGGMLAVVTIPNREGTLTRTWRAEVPAGLNTAQGEDVKAWVTQVVADFLLTCVGLQGVL